MNYLIEYIKEYLNEYDYFKVSIFLIGIHIIYINLN